MGSVCSKCSKAELRVGISSSVLGTGFCGPGCCRGPSMESGCHCSIAASTWGCHGLVKESRKQISLKPRFSSGFSWCPVCCLPSLALWETSSGLSNGVVAGLYSGTTGASALGQGKTRDLSLGWQEGEDRHSRPKSLPHVLLVSSVSHVHGEPLFLISS